MSKVVLDRHGRPLRSLRLSVTDRCNLRCRYCMPEVNYQWLPRPDLLTFEELTEVASSFLPLGVNRIRLTGGEPLLRQDLDQLIRMLAALPGLEDLALTTNGVLLADQAQALRDAGLHRITVSLDTLQAEKYQALSRVDGLAKTLAGIQAAQAAGFRRIKLDMVVLAGTNEDELLDMLAFAADHDCEARFIEYMDVGGATRWQSEEVYSRDQILECIREAHGEVHQVQEGEADSPGIAAPARRYRTASGQLFGIIASTTQPFCGDCDRSRVTADGHWFDCLYAAKGVDLRQLVRAGDPSVSLEEVLRGHWQSRDARGAEKRLELAKRGPQFDLDTLLSDPRLEMHTKGG